MHMNCLIMIHMKNGVCDMFCPAGPKQQSWECLLNYTTLLARIWVKEQEEGLYHGSAPVIRQPSPQSPPTFLNLCSLFLNGVVYFSGLGTVCVCV